MDSNNKVFYSPDGNPEMWIEGTQPDGYISEEVWIAKEEAKRQAEEEAELKWQNTYEYRYNEKLDEINQAFNSAIRRVKDLYPELEEETFTTQLDAVNTYLATQDTNSSEYSFLKTMADAREITVLELVEKIRKKAAAYRLKVAELVGIRHKYIDMLNTFDKTVNPQVIKDMEITY